MGTACTTLLILTIIVIFFQYNEYFRMLNKVQSEVSFREFCCRFQYYPVGVISILISAVGDTASSLLHKEGSATAHNNSVYRNYSTPGFWLFYAIPGIMH